MGADSMDGAFTLREIDPFENQPLPTLRKNT